MPGKKYNPITSEDDTPQKDEMIPDVIMEKPVKDQDIAKDEVEKTKPVKKEEIAVKKVIKDSTATNVSIKKVFTNYFNLTIIRLRKKLNQTRKIFQK